MVIFTCGAVQHKGAHQPPKKPVKIKLTKKGYPLPPAPPGALPRLALSPPVVTKGAFVASSKAKVETFNFSLPPSLWLIWEPKTWAHLEWDPNLNEGVSGYRTYQGLDPRGSATQPNGPYSRTYDVGSNTTICRVEIPPLQLTNYFAVTAFNEWGESEYSEEVWYWPPAIPPLACSLVRALPPAGPPNVVAAVYEIQFRSTLAVNWITIGTVTNQSSFSIDATLGTGFFRVGKK